MGKDREQKVTSAISGSHGFVAQNLAKFMLLKAIPRELLQDTDGLLELLSPIETVIHTAAYGNYHFQGGDREVFEVNVVLTYNLLEAAKKAGVKNFINFSSSYELGTKDTPMEEDMVAKPETMYGITKACGTQLTRHFSKFFNAVTVRPFSVIGVGEQDCHLIPTLIRSCLYGEKIKFVPDPVHDFIDVSDLCNGVLLVLNNADRLNGEIVHLGCGKQYTNQEVLEIVEELTGRKANIEIVDKIRDYDTKFWMADNTRLRSLGWKQTKTLEESVKEMVGDELRKKSS